MARRQERSRAVRRTAAVIMVGGLVAIIAAASGQFLGWFASTQTVTVQAPRAGLVMSPDAKVRLRGVPVGRVESIDTGDDEAVLTLSIDSDQMSNIPGNVGADIKSNTIFGAKAVNLVVPESGPSGQLQPDQTITADHVVVELNTVYQQLVNVLAELQPEKLNSVVGAVNTALAGQGEQVGAALEQLSNLLAKTNDHLPELDELIRQAATTTNVYADAAPDLMRTVDNFTYLGNTLVAESANLDALLINATGMADTINGELAPSKQTLISALTNLDPVSQLLGYQAPGIECFLTTSAVSADLAKPYFGGKNGNLLLYAGLLPGKEPYTYPESLPRVAAAGPPTCAGGLSDPTTKVHSDFYVTDNAPVPYQPRTKPKANREKLFQLLFGEPGRG
ncbi:MCE family protein [Gordonia sp. HNM0687]|uniref:MCE family protein n=1 Tax=Gordonia mangrovi TaxID=2665643 RepID=A0A6L7GJ81_9ACTN|nr:MCE family protein [Gordonia mangrovi]MXP19944.1 MCE family protein [Gordonia mangrovi]UVF79436.1 MCE family protein [Gordonia mangrovi]